MQTLDDNAKKQEVRKTRIRWAIRGFLSVSLTLLCWWGFEAFTRRISDQYIFSNGRLLSPDGKHMVLAYYVDNWVSPSRNLFAIMETEDSLSILDFCTVEDIFLPTHARPTPSCWISNDTVLFVYDQTRFFEQGYIAPKDTQQILSITVLVEPLELPIK